MMVNDIFTLMNHREIEYNAKKLSGCNIPEAFCCVEKEKLLEWLDESGERLFDEDLVMDYGTDCLRLYLLFEKTPKENDKYYDSWEEGALEGIYKFLGKYRRTILAALEWNSRGNYDISEEAFIMMNKTLEVAESKIDKCIRRANDMPNRHNIVVTLMETQKVIYKELKIAQIITQLHTHEIENAVPHETVQEEKEIRDNSLVDIRINEVCKRFIILTAPFAPYLSKILWNEC